MDGVLAAKGEADALRFAHLAPAATKRKTAPEKPSKDSSWSGKLEGMRVTYPNAFKPWKKADDAKLKQLFDDGIGLSELTSTFGRQPGSITSRLKKHFGEGVSVPK